MFSGSPPCLLGQHGSCSSAQLSENMLQNLFLNLSHTVDRVICEAEQIYAVLMTQKRHLEWSWGKVIYMNKRSPLLSFCDDTDELLRLHR